MKQLTSLPLVALLPLAALALAWAVASWTDVLHRRVPNWLCCVTALAGLTTGFLLYGWAPLGGQLLHFGIVLIAGMALFRLGIFGGGDAKFYAAVAAWFAPAKAVLLLVSIAFSGLALLLVWFSYRRLRGIPIGRGADRSHFDSMPYSVAIGGGAVLAMAMTTATAF
jgi:prepilin peptidase CpaA